MCGICGFASPQRAAAADVAAVDAMVRALTHRGPDEQSSWTEPGGRVVLGHTRLSIIDVEGSRQPMFNAAGDVALTYNGEVYNFRELRQELCRKGYPFRTQGDTEAVVHLYEEEGPSMVS